MKRFHVHIADDNSTHSRKESPMANNMRNVLFLCTGNSARSVMAEALVTILGNGRYKGYSAGSKPNGEVNPFAIEQITAYAPDFPTTDMHSKSWDKFALPDAPHMDFIITVCDNAAGEACPYWPGRPATAHWGFEDPAAVEGSDTEKRAEFSKIFAQIKTKMDNFMSLPLDSMNDHAIRLEIKKIGELPT
jgi:arsenate reductase